MKRQTMIISAAAIVGAAGIGAATLIPRDANPLSIAEAADLQSASFAVENMTCATCPITVQRAMQGVDGVDEVTIDYETKTALVRFHPARASTDAIAAASTEAGYPARVTAS
ncbi:MAG: heavy metal-associated domain-containing protein [Parasphingopyxis sp.]|uniref:heavy-metal-associated domain-containing protein n=1 Tax=Parasphingopyxis sp. TaxID=1920299 RepID=UPI0032EABFCE